MSHFKGRSPKIFWGGFIAPPQSPHPVESGCRGHPLPTPHTSRRRLVRTPPQECLAIRACISMHVKQLRLYEAIILTTLLCGSELLPLRYDTIEEFNAD